MPTPDENVQRLSSRSSSTLAEVPAASSSAEKPKPDPSSPSSPTTTFRMPLPEHPRSYRTAIDDPDREGEEAEREFADFAGDVPADKVMLRRTTRANVTMRRPSRSGTLGSVRSRTRSGTATSFPDLHLVDSAFSDAHRAISRLYSRTVTDTGEVIEVEQEPEDPNKVNWLENDVENPQNWSRRRRWAITLLCGLLTINVTFASSAPSSATAAIAKQFGVSNEVAVLTTSLFLLGYCVGPLLWAPISEMVGRRLVFVCTMIVYALFQLPSALATNIQSVLVGRFLAGVFAAAPLTNCGGVIADIWDPVGRGPALSIFTACVFLGPVLGPIIGGFVTQSCLHWRWVFWITMIFSGACWVLVVIFLPETYAPVLLAKRAKAMRKADPEKNKDKYADLERADFSPKSILTRTLARPFIMLATEPILSLVTLYLSVIYGLLYGLFSVFPIVWGELRGFNNGQVGLMFIGVGIGTTLGAIINILVQRHYPSLLVTWHGHPPPEERLWGAMLAGPCLLVGIFMLGWTGNYPSVHWIVPEIAALFLGMSFTLVFISFLSYLIETFLMFSASALAANTIVRSAVGAAFPLFTDQMFKRLGVNWACSLLGLIGILIFPVPYIFYKWGHRVRDGSNFAPCLDIHMRERVEKEQREEREKRAGHGV